MLLELVKSAGEQQLSVEMQYSDGMLHIALKDVDETEIYSVDSSDPIIAFNYVVLFLSDPEGYLDDMRASLEEAESLN